MMVIQSPSGESGDRGPSGGLDAKPFRGIGGSGRSLPGGSAIGGDRRDREDRAEAILKPS